MRNLYYFLFVLTLLSCSSDSGETIDEPEMRTELLVKSIIGSGDNGPDHAFHFNYENEILAMSCVFNGASSDYSKYKLNSDNKIIETTLYYDDGNNPDNTSTVDFENPLNFNNRSTSFRNIWSGGKLVESNGKTFYFNSEGRLDKIEYTDEKYTDESFIANISYVDNEITKIDYKWGDGSVRTYEYEFDSAYNPTYELFSKFGLTDLPGYGVFDYGDVFKGLFYQNNITKVYRDGELVFTATYEYNSDNYPISMNYYHIKDNTKGHETFTY